MTYPQDPLTFGIILLIIWSVIFLLGRAFPLERYGIEVSPVSITFKSSRFKMFLYGISEKGRSFWKTSSNLSIVLGAGLMVYSAYFLLDNLFNLLKPGVQGTPLLPVLPGLTIRLYWLPYLLLAVSLGIIMHEAAHGIISRVENISLKSAGLAVMLAFIAGFVEPDEEEFERASTTSKLRVLSSGSSINLTAFLIVILITSTVFVSVPSGIVVTEISEGSPLHSVGLQQWDVIYDVNGTLQNMVRDTPGALRNLTSLLGNTKSGDVLELSTSKGVQWIVVGTSTSGKSLGILNYMVYYPSRLSLGLFFDVQVYLTLIWGGIVYSNLAIFNMLPLFPFDGDKFLFYAVKGLSTKISRWVRIVFNALFFGIIALNMVLSLIKYGPFLI